MLHQRLRRDPRRLERGLGLFNMAMLAIALGLATLVALRWILANPHVSGWDQIQYIELSLRDWLTRALEGDGPFRDALFNDYRWMPPGSRLLALPLLLLHRTSETDFRLFSLALFVLSALMVFDAARRLAGRTVAAGCTALMVAAPVWVMASENYMSETALIPALALVLWCLVCEGGPRPPAPLPVVSGLALGLAWP